MPRVRLTEMNEINVAEERKLLASGYSVIADVCGKSKADAVPEIEGLLGWSPEDAERFYDQCQMVDKICGLSTMNVNALHVACDVSSIGALAGAEASSLLDKISSNNEIKLRKLPSVAQIQSWIDSACG